MILCALLGRIGLLLGLSGQFRDIFDYLGNFSKFKTWAVSGFLGQFRVIKTDFEYP